MSAPRLAPSVGWFASFSFNFDDEAATAVSPTLLSSGVRTWLQSVGATLAQPPDDRPNPRTMKIDGPSGTSRTIITCEVGFTLHSALEGSSVNLNVARSLHASGARWIDPGHVAEAMATCSTAETTAERVSSFTLAGLLIPSRITRVCADYAPLRGWPSTGVTSAAGSTAASLLSGRVSDSDHPAAIGTTPRALNGSLFDDLQRFVDSVPTWAKVAGGVVGVVGLGVAGGYVYRSFKR